jgi:hypothetical protein
LVLGIAAALVIHRAQRPAPLTSPALPSPEASEPYQLKKALGRAESRTRELEKENATLATELDQLRTATTNAVSEQPKPPEQMTSAEDSPFARMFGGSDTNRTAAFSKVMKAAMQQQVDIKLSALKLRLHLTDEQEQLVRDIFERQYGVATEMTSKMLEGKLTKEDAAKSATATPNAKDELQQILSPEQWAEYEKYQTEERQTQAQMMANVELMQMQSMLQLSPQQQDQVFKILYDQATQQFAQSEGGTKVAADWQQELDKQFEAKKEALRSVLTPEQFASYEKFINSQRNMIKAFMPSSENAGTATEGAHGTTVIPTAR